MLLKMGHRWLVQCSLCQDDESDDHDNIEVDHYDDLHRSDDDSDDHDHDNIEYDHHDDLHRRDDDSVDHDHDNIEDDHHDDLHRRSSSTQCPKSASNRATWLPTLSGDHCWLKSQFIY